MDQLTPDTVPARTIPAAHFIADEPGVATNSRPTGVTDRGGDVVFPQLARRDTEDIDRAVLAAGGAIASACPDVDGNRRVQSRRR